MKKFFRPVSFLLSIFVFLLFTGFNKAKPNYRNLAIDSRAAIAMDCRNNIVLFEKNSRELIPIASTTKILTALVAINYGDLNKEVEISKRAAGIRGSTVGFSAGEKVTIHELLYGLMLRSGNDAAIAIAEGVGGTVEEFLKLMNEYAGIIGLTNSHFESPHGLDSNEHYSTAYDLAVLTTKAKNNKVFNRIVGTKVVQKEEFGFKRSYNNINKILYSLPAADGVKTGYTGGAGKCLVTSVKIQGEDIVIVVLNSTPRWKETTDIYNYILNSFEFKKIYSKGDVVETINEDKNSIKLSVKDDLIIPLKKNMDYNVLINTPKVINNKKVKNLKEFGTIKISSGETILTEKKLIISK